MISKELERLLQRVQKPARYVGGEVNAVVKRKEDVDVRFAFCFPDVYEVGMSHLGMKILYGLFNAQPNIWCERVFAPWTDMEQEMRRIGMPLFALESGEPIRDFDFIGFTLQYELSFTNVLNMLDLAGVPLRSADRTELSPLVVAGGPCVCNAEPLGDFVDLMFGGVKDIEATLAADSEKIVFTSIWHGTKIKDIQAALNAVYNLGIGMLFGGSPEVAAELRMAPQITVIDNAVHFDLEISDELFERILQALLKNFEQQKYMFEYDEEGW